MKIASDDGRLVMETDPPTQQEEDELYRRIAGGPIAMLRVTAPAEQRLSGLPPQLRKPR